MLLHSSKIHSFFDLQVQIMSSDSYNNNNLSPYNIKAKFEAAIDSYMIMAATNELLFSGWD